MKDAKFTIKSLHKHGGAVKRALKTRVILKKTSNRIKIRAKAG